MQPDPRQLALTQLERTESYLAADPANPYLLAAAIDQALAAGLPERAGTHADNAVRLLPQDDFLRARLGNALLAQGRWADAAAVFDVLLARLGDPALVHGAAYARFRQGAHAEALAILGPCADQDVLPAATVALLVRLQHRVGEPETAFETARRHRATCGGDDDFLAAASLAALDADAIDEAQALAEAALARGGRPAEALVTAGSLALGRLDVATAQALLEEVLAARPEEGRAWSALGMASLLRRDTAAARQQFDTALRFIPSHIGTWHGLGWCCVFAGDLPGAEAAFRQALELDRNFGESHGGLAVTLALKGATTPAQESVDRALGLDAGSLSARYAQMVLAGETAEPERFRQLARRVLRGRQGSFGHTLAELMDIYQGS